MLSVGPVNVNPQPSGLFGLPNVAAPVDPPHIAASREDGTDQPPRRSAHREGYVQP